MRVKKKPGQSGANGWSAIETVAHNRMADAGQMNADLVRAPGSNAYPQVARFFKFFEYFVLR